MRGVLSLEVMTGVIKELIEKQIVIFYIQEQLQNACPLVTGEKRTPHILQSVRISYFLSSQTFPSIVR